MYNLPGVQRGKVASSPVRKAQLQDGIISWKERRQIWQIMPFKKCSELLLIKRIKIFLLK